MIIYNSRIRFFRGDAILDVNVFSWEVHFVASMSGLVLSWMMNGCPLTQFRSNRPPLIGWEWWAPVPNCTPSTLDMSNLGGHFPCPRNKDGDMISNDFAHELKPWASYDEHQMSRTFNLHGHDCMPHVLLYMHAHLSVEHGQFHMHPFDPSLSMGNKLNATGLRSARPPGPPPTFK